MGIKTYKKRKLKEKIKFHICRTIREILILTAILYLANSGIEYLKTVQWFVPKTITIVNKADLPVAVSAATEPANREICTSSAQCLIERYFGDNANIAIAIAQAESDFNSSAININKNGTRDIGLFQLNDCHGWSVEDRLDTEKNIKLAYDLYRQSGWSNWTTYKNGSYEKFLIK